MCVCGVSGYYLDRGGDGEEDGGGDGERGPLLLGDHPAEVVLHVALELERLHVHVAEVSLDHGDEFVDSLLRRDVRQLHHVLVRRIQLLRHPFNKEAGWVQ